MKRHKVTIKNITYTNHNVLELVTTKPKDYNYEPGQATDLALVKDDWEDEKRPFTFTNLPEDDTLQFYIKVYPSHDGVTEQLAELKIGDELTIGEAYGAIKYKGEGTFLAGGAGITPFIAILKSLEKKNELNGNILIFANKEKKDIFLEKTFNSLLRDNYLNVLSEEKTTTYEYGHIDAELIKNTIKNYAQYFYICGPPKMIESVIVDLKKIGVKDKNIITENFDD